MYCQNCGKQVSETDSFCEFCGNQIRSFVQNSNLQRNDIRNNEVEELKSLIAYFSLKTETYREYDAVCQKVEQLNKGKCVSLLVWGIILTGISSLLTLVCISDNVVTELYVILMLFLFLPGIMMILFFIRHAKNHDREKAIYYKKYYDLANDLSNHYLKYKNCPIGIEYSNPEFLQFLLEKIYSGRADTIKEALNIVVDESKYRILSEKLSEIQRNTSATATNASMAAIFSAANLMR
ncbi:MAG: zinc ribbon domain-containing protein [Ruminococcaceae bacterium]|nr:zinc ribbon domain-containing protein [Oscillospiraceae bacterium]